MKNKGLLHAKANPLAFRKDAVPEDLPNRIMADPEVSNTPDRPQIPASTPISAIDAAPAPTPATSKTRSRNQKTSKPDLSVPTQGGTTRYTLRLLIDHSTVEAIERLFTGLEGTVRSSAKKGFVRKFSAELKKDNLKKASYSPQNPDAYRLDLVLSDDFRDAVLSVENANPLEPVSAVIARNIAPSFIAYVKRIEESV